MSAEYAGMRKLPLQAELLELLRYDPDSGELFWRARINGSNSWNTQHAGKRAGAVSGKEGYRKVSIFDQGYPEHRIIWVMMHGDASFGGLDHINGDTSDNILSNLRVATVSQNAMNAKRSARNTSGFRGVSYESRPYYRKKWTAAIFKNGKNHRLGHFATAEEAGAAYIDAARTMFGEFARLPSSGERDG